jgi:hypothetical protein
MIHHLRKKKSKKGDLILKLDLEKAYDRLDWRFLRQTLNCFAFPEPIISLSMHGISSSSISCFGMAVGLRASLLKGVYDKVTLYLPISLCYAWRGLDA